LAFGQIEPSSLTGKPGIFNRSSGLIAFIFRDSGNVEIQLHYGTPFASVFFAFYFVGA
jgi:hypothetical protein